MHPVLLLLAAGFLAGSLSWLAGRAAPTAARWRSSTVIEQRQVALAAGFRVVVHTDGLLEAYGRWGGLDDQEVVRLVAQDEFACCTSGSTRAGPSGSATISLRSSSSSPQTGRPAPKRATSA
jgi:hypothetical protein